MPRHHRRFITRLREALTPQPCEHVPAAHAEARADACEECGSRSSLRICSTCGHVGCCDSQYGHARAHYHETGHPVMRAKTRGGTGFTWCYADNSYVSDRLDDVA
jgi:CPA1 family monovalent cation:H+ antiporter